MPPSSINKDDRSDKHWAWAVSIALHLAVTTWVLVRTSEAGQGQLQTGTSSASLSSRFIGSDEFRQPLITASSNEPSELPQPDPEPVTSAAITPVPEAATSVPAENAESEPGPTSTSSASSSTTQDAGAANENSVALPQLEANSYDPKVNAYLAAVRATIQSKWVRTSQQNGHCSVTIQQTIGGRVVGATATSCILGNADRQALEAAALAAQPLPYAGFEQAFREHLTVEMGQ